MRIRNITTMLVLTLVLAAATPAAVSQAASPPASAAAATQTSTQPAPALTPKKPVDDTPVKIALLTEENLQLKAQAAQQQAQQTLAPLQQQYMEQEKVIADWVDEVKRQNGWGADVIYDRTERKFRRQAAAAAANQPATTPPTSTGK